LVARRQGGRFQKVYAVVSPIKENLSVELCWQKPSGGPLYKLTRLVKLKPEEIELPKQAFAVLPVLDIFNGVTTKVTQLMKNSKRHATQK
jgi:hypothetical protein